jgi:hypothetical protein
MNQLLLVQQRETPNSAKPCKPSAAQSIEPPALTFAANKRQFFQNDTN